MLEHATDATSLAAFERNLSLVLAGESGLIPEMSIAPIDLPAFVDGVIPRRTAQDALRATVIIKLNGGLGTTMGLAGPKSALMAREGLSFLDIIVRQVLRAREKTGASLPLLFMNSFRTSKQTMSAMARYPEAAVHGLPQELMQSRVPKLRESDLRPVEFACDPELEWCPPGHGDLYPALWSSGLIGDLLALGYTQVFVSNSDNLCAVPDEGVAGWFAARRAPIAVEAVRRTASDRKGGHFALRISDGRIVLRESAQTAAEDLTALVDLTRHRFMSTNNLWLNLHALKAELDRCGGVLPLPLIRNRKTVDPTDPTSETILQLESAMGAAIECFEGGGRHGGWTRPLPAGQVDQRLAPAAF